MFVVVLFLGLCGLFVYFVYSFVFVVSLFISVCNYLLCVVLFFVLFAMLCIFLCASRLRVELLLVVVILFHCWGVPLRSFASLFVRSVMSFFLFVPSYCFCLSFPYCCPIAVYPSCFFGPYCFYCLDLLLVC